MKIIKFLFSSPLFRHLVAAVLIITVLYLFVLEPLQTQIAKQHQLIEYMAKKDTYSITNAVDAKIKKGGEIKLIPDNKLNVVNADTVKANKRKHWWQFWE